MTRWSCLLWTVALAGCTDSGDETGVDAGPEAPAPDPAAPPDEAGAVLPWLKTGTMAKPVVVANRDSAVLRLTAVAGARDYRAFRAVAGVKVVNGASGAEGIQGTTITCAGTRQAAAPAPTTFAPVTEIELYGVTGPATYVVEALADECPFPGIIGPAHAEVAINPEEVPPAERQAFSFFTEAEVRAKYGSLILNGHGPAAVLGQPAPANQPRVLARTTVVVAPAATPPAPPATFFDGFTDDTQQPRLVDDALPDFDRNQRGRLYQNDRWNFLTYGAEVAQFSIARGALHMALADWEQAIFSEAVAMPRRAVQIDDTTYTRITWEVSSNATPRRYWWVSLCGPSTKGTAFNADGTLQGHLIQTPFFFDADGRHPMIEKWNCFQIFMRDGSPFEIAGDARASGDVRVMVNKADGSERDSVVNVSPDQYKCCSIPPSWYRQEKGGVLGAPVIDDKMGQAPRTAFELYLRRDRAILVVDGQQRLCNTFPNAKLTMAEGALGFGQVLYHSSAERMELPLSFDLRTGQRYYLTNTPFADARSWDNLGFEEGAAAPPGFDASSCYVSDAK